MYSTFPLVTPSNIENVLSIFLSTVILSGMMPYPYLCALQEYSVHFLIDKHITLQYHRLSVQVNRKSPYVTNKVIQYPRVVNISRYCNQLNYSEGISTYWYIILPSIWPSVCCLWGSWFCVIVIWPCHSHCRWRILAYVKNEWINRWNRLIVYRDSMLLCIACIISWIMPEVIVSYRLPSFLCILCGFQEYSRWAVEYS